MNLAVPCRLVILVLHDMHFKVTIFSPIFAEFSGDLKPFRSLKTYLDEIIQQFDQ